MRRGLGRGVRFSGGVLTRRSHTVPPEARGTRLDAFLASVEPELTRSRLKALIEDGAATLDGKPSKPGKTLKGGELVSLDVPAPVPATPEAEALALSVMYEDRDLVVVDKAAGMVVHPAAGVHSGTLVNALLHHVKDLQGIGGELRPGIVHRLDKDTSGCLVVAKNEATLNALQAQFKKRSVEKTYLALVHGAPKKDEERLETLFGRHPTDRKRFTSRVQEGRKAITVYRVLERFPGAALLEIDLFTGRTHQIRVHCYETGHPLLCDALYGGKKREAKLPPNDPARRAADALGRQALHAWRLAFEHPRTGERLRFEAPLPADFERALAVLRG